MRGRVRTISRRLTRVIICSLLTVMLIPMPVAAIEVAPEPTTYYVDVYNQGASDGSMIAPFPTITEALDQASPGDTIMVASGHYTPITGETMPLQLLPGITLKSAAGSSETTIDAMFDDAAIVFSDLGLRNLDPLPEPPVELPITVEGFTVVNGLSEGADALPDVAPSQSYSGGCLAFFEAPPTTLRDLVVTDGVAEVGGGLYAFGTELTIEDCTFSDNGWWPEGFVAPTEIHAPILPGEPAVMAGGAVFLSLSTATISDTTFENNVAMYEGGAIFADRSEVTISGGQALGNFAIPEGIGSEAALPAGGGAPSAGGFAVLYESHLAAESLVATGNVAFVGGVIAANETSRITFEDSIISENQAFIAAGVYQGYELLYGVPTTCDAYGEAADSRATSAPMYPLFMDRCVLEGNEAAMVSTVYTDGELAVMDSLFVGNADSFVTVAASAGSRIDGSTFVENMTGMGVLSSNMEVFPSGEVVPAPYIETPSELVNSIVWNNTMTPTGVQADLPLPPPPVESDSVIQNWSAAYSDVQGSFEGTASISTDPMFTDPDQGDYRLDEGSPCIDAGTWETDSAVDLDGLVRPVDGDFNGAEDFDMGAYESAGPRMDRLAGADRYETAVEVSAERFASADTVVIATGRVFADGLAASGLAGAYNAPLLLTGSDYLPAVVADEIVRLGAANAIVVGGLDAVDGGVFGALEDMGLDVTRIGGADRYETAAMLAEDIRSVMGDDMAPVAFVARGDLYPDALAVSPVAYALGAPILLVRPDELPESTVDVISEMGIASVVVAGGTSAVGVSVAGGIAEAGATIKRINGADRYETAAMFAEYAVGQGWASYTVTGLATGAAFPDALSGGAALGQINGVLLLTPRDTLAASASDVLTARADEIIYLRTLGGSAAVSVEVQAAAEALVE